MTNYEEWVLVEGAFDHGVKANLTCELCGRGGCRYTYVSRHRIDCENREVCLTCTRYTGARGRLPVRGGEQLFVVEEEEGQ